MSKAELLSSLRKSEYVEEYGDVLKALGDGSYALVDKELWSLSSSGILRKEVQTCIPEKALGAALQWTHDVVGHPGPDSWLWAFVKMFHTLVPDTELAQKNEDMHRTCKECVTSKRNLPSDRGLLGVLPLPHLVNALLYVDFIDRPKCHNYDYALMMVDALSTFCQVVPCKKTIGFIGFVSIAHLFASTVTRIFASRETKAGSAMFSLQLAWKYYSHNLTALNQTDYASVGMMSTRKSSVF